MKGWIAVILWCLSVPARAEDPRSVYHTRAGIQQMEKEKLQEGYDQLLKAVALDPMSPAAHYNLGLAFLLREDYAKALKEFRLAAELSGNQASTQYLSYFNMGVAATGLKDLDLALSSYQAALDAQPDSHEAKTNIELLLRQEQGGGKGDSENQDDSSDQDQQDQKDQPKNQENQPQAKPTPQKFKEQDLKEQEVKVILEELKRQEQKIRAKMEEKQIKEKSNGKDW